MATEEEVASWKAAWYVAKYASKSDPSIPRGFRRCRASRDWAKLPEVKLAAYLVKSRVETLAGYLIRVSDHTNVDIDTLYLRYRIANNSYDLGGYDDE